MDLDWSSSVSAYRLLFRALSLIPISHYLLFASLILIVLLYRFLEFHFLQDLFSLFAGSPVALTFHPASDVYDGVVSKCRILHGSYLATPWLSSPHLQTVFLNFFGRPPFFKYRRQLFTTPDGGTVALDWLMSSDVSAGATHVESVVCKDESTPIVVVIPGLTSDSSSAYLKHLAYHTAKCGWKVVISNHRGLGGVSITSDCFYNAGWTEDVRTVVSYLHRENPRAPLFIVGTSIGANVLIKYLGEEGENTPVAGAVAVCSPWDLLIGDRFITRRRVQKFYDKALAVGLQGYAKLHQPHFSRLANWEGIEKSISIRDFDNHATRIVGKYETVDTYYRRCSSSNYVQFVSIPLLCISALDDPVCTREAIPWDECRANKNVVLATVKHGGHLAFFEGITASGLWWVRAVNEFLGELHASDFMHVQKKIPKPNTPLGTSIDRGPYVNVTEDGMVAALNNELKNDNTEEIQVMQDTHNEGLKMIPEEVKRDELETNAKTVGSPAIAQIGSAQDATANVMRPFKIYLGQLSRQNQWSIWLLVYIAITTSWPLVGSALYIVFGKKIRNILPNGLLRR
ncbi:embryogenesis-associated protein EMB8-like [Vigna unguiculata]|uniref:Alpha/Beta hydrolase fold n=1 Tax=Vigna unguiculata TaxID=3917 RepID=A0A4D6N787_VIGUN|nr:embryogenesis-associated protein EMB8-like [Vigna unguiculata]QCE07985.1 Alpha/Beta hydrolase fold [Vigna unguiculata]